ncbi:type II toxin-antitoxin system HicA family toxin [Afifella sp. IM 167]|uniref:type II toxin-antitoxin system HicA family toxin n=1 Tax=Afifella sp. IM 167 TaxID=2033586 RepID=UPI001CC936BB|nr:type II toxin-antitoxin system HicA family toxin [Afifella sp. IM 167]MBZ8132920.1 hypothetical protein [Afifella sp. IM 167]
MGNYYRDLAKILRASGCRFVRQGTGSHEVWYSPLSQRHFTVAVTVASRHTANAVLKQAGISRKL